MRYAIFSDIHSNLEALSAVMNAYKKEGVDKYLCVGDCVGYGADPNECVDIVRKSAEATVAGNHDWAAVGMFPIDYFNTEAAEAIFWTKGVLSRDSEDFLKSARLVFKNQDLTLVHGTLDSPEEFNYLQNSFNALRTFRAMETAVCFVAHTHQPALYTLDIEAKIHARYATSFDLNLVLGHKYIVNVGSVGQPRDGFPQAAYCVYDTAKKQVRLKRVAYNIAKARDKIVNAGLPQGLGERLSKGM